MSCVDMMLAETTERDSMKVTVSVRLGADGQKAAQAYNMDVLISAIALGSSLKWELLDAIVRKCFTVSH